MPASRVLVVDDLMVIADLLGELLTDEGFQVRVAYRWTAAETLARQFQPQAIILDYEMPGKSGTELVPLLSHAIPERPVFIFYTIYAEAPDRRAAMMACGNPPIFRKTEVHYDLPTLVKVLLEVNP